MTRTSLRDTPLYTPRWPASGRTDPLDDHVHCPEVPPELTGLVDQMLAWERWDRPSSAEVNALLDQIGARSRRPPGIAGLIRIRKPRWTPALHLGEGDPELTGCADTGDAADTNAGESS
jgi:hypothetical protein